jgi:hypothetical protein
MNDVLAGWNPETDRPYKCDHRDKRYRLGKRVGKTISCAFEFDRNGPTTRRLRIFAIDPAASALEGKTTTADVPYEPLEAGPAGRLFEVDARDDSSGNLYVAADLDDPVALLGHGFSPSESDPRFHAQMVYAVASLVHSAFRRALGRQIGWPFESEAAAPRLRLRPFACISPNAWYDPGTGTIHFGYFRATEKIQGRTLPSGYVFTALSHDIVAHEMSHAMLDALRANFAVPSSNDMTGFHEGFADIVALFQHFQYTDALRTAIADCRGKLADSPYLCSIGQQFGRASGGEAPLRSATDAPAHYAPTLSPHEMGHLLLGAVFDAFVTVYDRKVATMRRLASGGTGVLPEGRLPDLLVQELARKASELAQQFLSILIRAVDYLPPVDVRLGEYLRAIITADSELVPDDPWGYREAMIDAFRNRGIYPRDVPSLNEDSLLWKQPDADLAPVTALSFREIWFNGDPGLPVSQQEQYAQACELGEYVTQSPEHMRAFGLLDTGDPQLDGDTVSLPTVESIRTLRRPGPDGRIVFDTVAEIIQVRNVQARDGSPAFDMHGGATVILDSNGAPRYVIRKSVVADGRVRRRTEYLESPLGQRFWEERGEAYVMKREMFMALCADVGRGEER